MKRKIVIAVCLFAIILLSSCKAVKKCPAYAMMDKVDNSKEVKRI